MKPPGTCAHPGCVYAPVLPLEFGQCGHAAIMDVRVEGYEVARGGVDQDGGLHGVEERVQAVSQVTALPSIGHPEHLLVLGGVPGDRCGEDRIPACFVAQGERLLRHGRNDTVRRGALSRRGRSASGAKQILADHDAVIIPLLLKRTSHVPFQRSGWRRPLDRRIGFDTWRSSTHLAPIKRPTPLETPPLLLHFHRHRSLLRRTRCVGFLMYQSKGKRHVSNSIHTFSKRSTKMSRVDRGQLGRLGQPGTPFRLDK
jgi:hypothetical protein